MHLGPKFRRRVDSRCIVLVISEVTGVQNMLTLAPRQRVAVGPNAGSSDIGGSTRSSLVHDEHVCALLFQTL